MTTRLTRVLVACLVCPLTLLLNTFAGAAELPPSTNLTELLSKYEIPRSAVSIDIREVGTQTPILTLNRNVPRNPASVIKLLTTLSSLELLGPAYTWGTKYLFSGSLSKGTLEGDLIMQGGGDPFLTVDRFWRHVHSIRQRGIQHINGDFVIDNSAFEVEAHNPGAFDGKATRLYNVGASASLVNFSATHFVIRPTDRGITIFADPPLSNLSIENNLTLRNGKCTNPQAGWSFENISKGDKLVIRFNGKYQTRCGQYSLGRNIVTNDQYTYRLFKHLWLASGGTLKGSARIDVATENAIAIVNQPSEPLSAIVTSINKFSNNVMARQLLLTIGSHFYGAPGTVEAGVIAIQSWLDHNGISMPNLVLENGSGLSRKTRVSAKELADLLDHGWRSNYRPEFLSSLSLSALDGTMRNRLKETPMLGRARIKTGLVNGVRSMAGYLHSKKGIHYSVVMMIDSKKVNYWNGNQIQDALLSWLYYR
ncbi:MAG: D-alanyl-D-alanine carboxypeptidase/D-alanyl-D-alanine-endopeptidase [Gammaproteobacteria bacterium]|nr:D-alanyl-D-alanine carboxypeptidase/D-alanyl-D-alanine-endopeptidase [Gammaproteobacteria bacterium]